MNTCTQDNLSKLATDNERLKAQLQTLVFAAYIPLTMAEFESAMTDYRILKNEVVASEALLEELQ